jgi:hypothetical protein
MKKLTAILLSIALFAVLAACTKAPAETEVSATPSANNFYPTATATPSSPAQLASDESRETVTEGGKPILYVGSFSGGSYETEDAFSWLEKYVRYFNSKNKEYEARVIDYGDSSGSDAMYRLNAEIISDKMPDLLVTHGMPVDKYAALDLLYDMTDWLNPEEFFAGPLEAMKTDGKLYEVSPVITVTTFYGLTKYLEASGAMSLDDMEQFDDGSLDKSFIAGLSNEMVCLLLISAYEENFINRIAATSDFNSAEFLKLLDFCKKLPANPPELNLKADIGLSEFEIGKSTIQMSELHRALAVKRETALLGILATSRLWGIPYAPHHLVSAALGGADYRFIGYPGENTASVYADFPFAVSANTANPDGAKAFIDDLWLCTFASRGGDDMPLMPLKKLPIEKAVDKQWKTLNLTDKEYEDFLALKDSDNPDDVKVYEKQKGIIRQNVLMFQFGENAPYYYLDDWNSYKEVIDAASVRVRSPLASYLPPLNNSQVHPDRQGKAPPASSFVNPIIAEEIQAFFGGIQDANRTAELIQSRYSIYLSEQMK